MAEISCRDQSVRGLVAATARSKAGKGGSPPVLPRGTSWTVLNAAWATLCRRFFMVAWLINFVGAPILTPRLGRPRRGEIGPFRLHKADFWKAHNWTFQNLLQETQTVFMIARGYIVAAGKTPGIEMHLIHRSRKRSKDSPCRQTLPFLSVVESKTSMSTQNLQSRVEYSLSAGKP